MHLDTFCLLTVTSPKVVQSNVSIWMLFGQKIITWTLFGHDLDTIWTHFVFVHIMETFWTYFGHILSKMCPKCVYTYIVNQHPSDHISEIRIFIIRSLGHSNIRIYSNEWVPVFL